MNRPFTARSPYSLTPTERRGHDGGSPVDQLDYDPHYDAGYRPGYDEGYDEHYDGYADEYDDYADEYADFEDDEARIDRRWMWVAGIAGAILFVAVGTTGVILGGGDSGSVTAAQTSTAPSPSATASSATRAPLVPTLPPETVTTVTPSAEAAPTAQPTAQPVVPPTQAVPPAQAAPPPAPAPRTVTYRVTGNRQLIDLVTVIYTDAQGALRTDVNAALPWAKTIVLDPGVELSSVTATSVAGQLNCSITDASGAVIAAQNNNTIITNCTK